MNRRSDVAMPERIRVRVLAEEKQIVQQAAKKLGLSMSDFVRHAVSQAAEKLAA